MYSTFFFLFSNYFCQICFLTFYSSQQIVGPDFLIQTSSQVRYIICHMAIFIFGLPQRIFFNLNKKLKVLGKKMIKRNFSKFKPN